MHVGQSTCTMTAVHVLWPYLMFNGQSQQFNGHSTCTMPVIHARAGAILQACTIVMIHETRTCATATVQASTTAIAQACVLVLVHASRISTVHACTIAAVHARSIAIERLYTSYGTCVLWYVHVEYLEYMDELTLNHVDSFTNYLGII